MGLKDNAESPFIFNRSHLTNGKAIEKHRLTLVQEEDTSLELQEVPGTGLLVYVAFVTGNKDTDRFLQFLFNVCLNLAG